MKSQVRSGTFAAAQFGLAMLLPLLATAAEPLNGSDSQPAKGTVPTQSATGPYDPTSGGAGIYDQDDRFKDSKGFPLPGYGHVIEPSS